MHINYVGILFGSVILLCLDAPDRSILAELVVLSDSFGSYALFLSSCPLFAPPFYIPLSIVSVLSVDHLAFLFVQSTS